MKLKDILKYFPDAIYQEITDFAVESLEIDSRNENKNGIFLAINGLSVDGALYADEAIKKGAKAIFYETQIENFQAGINYIKIASLREKQGLIASLVYQNPAESLFSTAVTGTNGKTSFTYIFKHIIEKAFQVNCGLFGNIKYDLIARVIDFPKNNTPDSVYLQKYLKEINLNQGQNFVMEVSSHALELFRIENIAFNQAVFMNLSQDHLDFHKDMESYFEAKRKLFANYLKENAAIIINQDDLYGRRLAEEFKNCKSFSCKDANADLFCKSYSYDQDNRLVLNLLYKNKDYCFSSNLNGAFQVYNIMAAILAALDFRDDLESILKVFEEDIVIPGRMEEVFDQQGKVFIDYAHTPDALENLLKSAKVIPHTKLTVLFGCGGDRDRRKRSLMGEIAERLADKVIVTSDNPRTESPMEIIKDITRSMKSKPEVIVARKKAIEYALQSRVKGEIILIAGKGHEVYQEVNKEKLPFSDKEIVKEFLKVK